MHNTSDHEFAGRLVTTTAAARLAGVSAATIRRLISGGAIPAYRVGRRALRVRFADVEEYVRRRQVAPVSQGLLANAVEAVPTRKGAA